MARAVREPSGGGGANPIRVGEPVVIDPAAISAGLAGADGTASDGDNGNGGSGLGDGVEPGKRRRAYTKRTGRTGASAKAEGLPIASIALSLHALHAGLATLTGNEIWKIDGKDAEAIATAVSNVSRHYDLPQTEKAIDWFNLFATLGAMYGTKLVVIRSMRAAEKAAAKRAAPSDPNVFSFSGALGQGV